MPARFRNYEAYPGKFKNFVNPCFIIIVKYCTIFDKN